MPVTTDDLDSARSSILAERYRIEAETCGHWADLVTTQKETWLLPSLAWIDWRKMPTQGSGFSESRG
jgi:hypothetical protein